MLLSGMQFYHLELILSSGTKCYHLGWNVIIWDDMLSSVANGIIWDKMLSFGMKHYHLEPMLSSGTTCYHLGWIIIIWDAMLSSGANVVIWDKMLSSGANVLMVSSGANVIIWCYHVMLSSGMITPPFFVFPGNFTHSNNPGKSWTLKGSVLVRIRTKTCFANVVKIVRFSILALHGERMHLVHEYIH